MQLDLKADCRPWPLAGYAPGNYTCKCIDCEERFSGDKRAIRCLECAAVVANQRLQAVQPVPVAWRCKDYADGWIIYQDEARARHYQNQTCCLMEALYAAPLAAQGGKADERG